MRGEHHARALAVLRRGQRERLRDAGGRGHQLAEGLGVDAGDEAADVVIGAEVEGAVRRLRELGLGRRRHDDPVAAVHDLRVGGADADVVREVGGEGCGFLGVARGEEDSLVEDACGGRVWERRIGVTAVGGAGAGEGQVRRGIESGVRGGVAVEWRVASGEWRVASGEWRCHKTSARGWGGRKCKSKRERCEGEEHPARATHTHTPWACRRPEGAHGSPRRRLSLRR